MPANPTTSSTSSAPSHEAITQRARALWEQRGRPEGRDLEHWLEAERQLRGAGAASEAAPKPAPAARPPGTKSTKESMEAERRLDGLVQNKPSPASRTPKGERL